MPLSSIASCSAASSRGRLSASLYAGSTMRTTRGARAAAGTAVGDARREVVTDIDDARSYGLYRRSQGAKAEPGPVLLEIAERPQALAGGVVERHGLRRRPT